LKYGLFISDTHCGHGTGLTPPQYWQESLKADDPRIRKEAMIRKTIWEFAERLLTSRRWDYLFSVGDLVDGKGAANGGIEQITTDRIKQVDMATEALSLARAKTIRMVRGTPFHTGKEENFEDIIAQRLDAIIKDHLFVDVDGTVVDLKHKIGGSSIPHGRATALLRSEVWALLWNERGLAPKPDLIVRGHVHFHLLIKDFQRTRITMPCLQWDSQYGKRECEGTIDLGMVEVRFSKGGIYEIIPHELVMDFARAEAEKI
jgi:hypothetical protein